MMIATTAAATASKNPGVPLERVYPTTRSGISDIVDAPKKQLKVKLGQTQKHLHSEE